MRETHETVVTITRAKQYAVPGRNYRFAWQWFYSWAASDGSHMVPNPAGRMVNIGSYGRGLGDLQNMLRRRYGRGVRIVKAWEDNQ